MRKLLIAVIELVISAAISWAVVVGILKLITMCFSIGFSFPVATGIWLVICLMRLIFYKSEERR